MHTTSEGSRGPHQSGKGCVKGQCALGTEGMEPRRLRIGPAGYKVPPSPARWVLKVKPSLFALHSFQGLVTSEDVDTAVLFAPAA